MVNGIFEIRLRVYDLVTSSRLTLGLGPEL